MTTLLQPINRRKLSNVIERNWLASASPESRDSTERASSTAQPLPLPIRLPQFYDCSTFRISPSVTGEITPFSVTSPVMFSAGATSKAGL